MVLKQNNLYVIAFLDTFLESNQIYIACERLKVHHCRVLVSLKIDGSTKKFYYASRHGHDISWNLLPEQRTVSCL